jgi:hypothetical protein
MSSFQDEVGIVPWPAWFIAALCSLGMATLLLLLPLRTDPNVGGWPLWGKVLLLVGPALLTFAWFGLVGYVYADAKRRGMRYVLWTVLAVLIPNAIGIVLYFVLRDPLLAPCSQCHMPVRQGFAFCPNCGAQLSRACPQCRSALEPGWSHCAHCGKPV